MEIFSKDNIAIFVVNKGIAQDPAFVKNLAERAFEITDSFSEFDENAVVISALSARKANLFIFICNPTKDDTETVSCLLTFASTPFEYSNILECIANLPDGNDLQEEERKSKAKGFMQELQKLKAEFEKRAPKQCSGISPDFADGDSNYVSFILLDDLLKSTKVSETSQIYVYNHRYFVKATGTDANSRQCKYHNSFVEEHFKSVGTVQKIRDALF